MQAASIKDALDYILTFPSWRQVTDCANADMVGHTLIYANRNGGLFSCVNSDNAIVGIAAGWIQNEQSARVEFLFADSLFVTKVLFRRFVQLYPGMYLTGHRHGKAWMLSPNQQQRIIYGRKK